MKIKRNLLNKLQIGSLLIIILISIFIITKNTGVLGIYPDRYIAASLWFKPSAPVVKALTVPAKDFYIHNYKSSYNIVREYINTNNQLNDHLVKIDSTHSTIINDPKAKNNGNYKNTLSIVDNKSPDFIKRYGIEAEVRKCELLDPSDFKFGKYKNIYRMTLRGKDPAGKVYEVTGDQAIKECADTKVKNISGQEERVSHGSLSFDTKKKFPDSYQNYSIKANSSYQIHPIKTPDFYYLNELGYSPKDTIKILISALEIGASVDNNGKIYLDSIDYIPCKEITLGGYTAVSTGSKEDKYECAVDIPLEKLSTPLDFSTARKLSMVRYLEPSVITLYGTVKSDR